jgi:hypothetical protein
MAEVKRIETKYRTAMKVAEQLKVEANGDFSEPDWQEAVSRDGVRCYVTRSRRVATKALARRPTSAFDSGRLPRATDLMGDINILHRKNVWFVLSLRTRAHSRKDQKDRDKGLL